MKSECFQNAAQYCNCGNFLCNNSVAIDGIQDLLFKMHFFHYKHLRACRHDNYYCYYYYYYYYFNIIIHTLNATIS